jgi:hypothetical protein
MLAYRLRLEDLKIFKDFGNFEIAKFNIMLQVRNYIHTVKRHYLK